MVTRIDNPDKITESTIFSAIRDWGLPVIQFSKPGQSKALLKSLNTLCKIFGKRLPIRFYAHYQNDFDASILEHLPDVQWLLIDCLREISNPEKILGLSKLKKLSFGVYHYDNPDFLHHLRLNNLEDLSISENKKRNFDLSPLRDAAKIRSLFIEGHHKHIDAIGNLAKLKSLRLYSTKKTTRLDFVSNMTALDTLEIVLGGRANINEITLPLLRTLKIVRVRGFNDLGDLSRFPSLRSLHVEDQIKLLSFSLQNPELRKLEILNCKSLAAVSGLEALKKIKNVRCYGTALDYETLTELDWAKSLDVLAFYSGQKNRDEMLRRKLRARGYKEVS